MTNMFRSVSSAMTPISQTVGEWMKVTVEPMGAKMQQWLNLVPKEEPLPLEGYGQEKRPINADVFKQQISSKVSGIVEGRKAGDFEGDDEYAERTKTESLEQMLERLSRPLMSSHSSSRTHKE